MVSPRSLAIAIAGLSLLPLTSATADDDHRFVITPLLGYRGGGEFDALVGTATPDIDATESYGMALSMNLGQRHALELLYTFQPSEFQDNGLELDNDEQGTPVWICRQPRRSWSQVWPELYHM